MPLHVPGSLDGLLSLLAPCLTQPTFRTFRALVIGFIARVGEHTVTGMWQAARLAGVVHHSRAHDFFSRARWCPDTLGLRLLDLLVAVLVEAGAPIRLALDDTVFGRSGRKVFGTFLHHDAHPEAGRGRFRFGNSWVCVGLVVRLQVVPHRPICLPLLFRLYRLRREGAEHPSRPELGRELVELVARRYPGRRVELVADAAYVSRALAGLPANVTVTARLRRDAALHGPPPPRTGRRGRPRNKGERLPSLAQLATRGSWRTGTVRRYGKQAKVETLALDCLWYSVLRDQPVRVVLCRERKAEGFDIALISTDTDTSACDLLACYSERWAIEVSFQDAKQVLGVGEAHNRTQRAVLRTVPFGFLCQSITICWYALAGQADVDVERRRLKAPWYRDKRAPSTLDMLAALRRELIRAQYRPGRHCDPTPPQITQPLYPAAAEAA